MNRLAPSSVLRHSMWLIVCSCSLCLPVATALAGDCKPANKSAKRDRAAQQEPASSQILVNLVAAEADAVPGVLSVGPADELRYPDDRPAWIDAGPELDGQVHRWPVSSPLSSTAELSRRALTVQLRAAAETYVETLFDSPDAPAVIPLQDRWIADRLADDRSYEGEVLAGDEVLYEAAAELRFTAKDRAWLQTQWDSHRVSQRMVGLGAMTAGGTVLLLMATAGLSVIARRVERSSRVPASDTAPIV